MSRILAIMFGLVAGIGAFLFLYSSWEHASSFLDAIGLASVATALNNPAIRFVWAMSASVTAFAVTTLLILLVAGWAETLTVRNRLNALRHDLALADAWNIADWRAAFSGSMVGDWTETIVTGIVPGIGDAGRRVVTDTALFLALDTLWLDRLTLNRMIGRLPLLLFGLGLTSSLLSEANSGGDGQWIILLAAGSCAAFIVALMLYLVRSALMPFVALSIRAAKAAIRPVTSQAAFDTKLPLLAKPAPRSADPAGTEPFDADVIAAAIATALAEPLRQLTEAVDRLNAGGGANQREQAIDAALAEVRAGIERLLAQSRKTSS